jgi:hypothetical protein
MDFCSAALAAKLQAKQSVKRSFLDIEVSLLCFRAFVSKGGL